MPIRPFSSSNLQTTESRGKGVMTPLSIDQANTLLKSMANFIKHSDNTCYWNDRAVKVPTDIGDADIYITGTNKPAFIIKLPRGIYCELYLDSVVAKIYIISKSSYVITQKDLAVVDGLFAYMTS